jgi:hypothetical protein
MYFLLLLKVPVTLFILSIKFARDKAAEREANDSPPSSDEVTYAWRYTSNPLYLFTTRCIINHR